MPDEILIEAEMMTGAELAAFEERMARVKETPGQPGRILSHEESHQRLKAMIDKGKMALTNKPA